MSEAALFLSDANGINSLKSNESMCQRDEVKHMLITIQMPAFFWYLNPWVMIALTLD